MKLNTNAYLCILSFICQLNWRKLSWLLSIIWNCKYFNYIMVCCLRTVCTFHIGTLIYERHVLMGKIQSTIKSQCLNYKELSLDEIWNMIYTPTQVWWDVFNMILPFAYELICHCAYTVSHCVGWFIPQT